MSGFQNLLDAQEKGEVLTEQDLLKLLQGKANQPQKVVKTNPLSGGTSSVFTPVKDETPLVYAPEERQKIQSWKDSFRAEPSASAAALAPTAATEVAKSMLTEKGATEVAKNVLAEKGTEEAAKNLTGGVPSGTGLALSAAGQAVGGTAGDILGGAGTGAAFGPVGMGIGAVAGGIAGGLKAKAKRKAEKRAADANAQQNISMIEQETGRNKNVGLNNILSALQSALVRR